MLCVLGNACGSNVHCRDCSKSDTWAAGITEGILHSPRDGCKFFKYWKFIAALCEAVELLLSFLKSVSSTSYFSHILTIFVQGGYGIGSLAVNTLSGWRYMYATSVPLAVIMGIGMWWLPASPRWLLLRVIQGKGNVENQKEAAIKSLCRLRGPAFADSAAEQVNEILAELSFVGEDKEATFGELFQGKCKKALIIGGGLVLFQQVGTVKT